MTSAVRLATRGLTRLLLTAALVLSATLFASSSLTDPETTPYPSSDPSPEPRFHAAASPALPLSRTATLRTTMVGGRSLSYCSNGSIDRPAHEVTRVIMVIHGNDRQSCGVAKAVLAAATPEQRERTLVVAPRFPTTADKVNPATQHYWTFYGWSQGDRSLNRDNQLSSYAVLDDLRARVQHLPQVITGFSGGGQFIARYAAGTPDEPLRFIIVNPSSYLYWTAERPGIPRARLAACPNYNSYRYGLRNLNAYMGKVGPKELAHRFSERHVVYLLGSADNDPRSTSMDQTCGAMAEGRNRFERGERYWAYLSTVFGPEVHTRHTKHTVPGVAHNPFPMYAAPRAKQALFR